VEEKRIRIYPKAREIDAERMAMALLALVAQLTPEDKARFVALGEGVLADISGASLPKGSKR